MGKIKSHRGIRKENHLIVKERGGRTPGHPPLLLCSRHHPAFLQQTGSGSHLYTANLHTLRSGHRKLDLLALVGTPLWGCRSLTLYLYYIIRIGVCQEVFQLFLKKRTLLLSAPFVLDDGILPLDIYIVSQTIRFVNTFFKRRVDSNHHPINARFVVRSRTALIGAYQAPLFVF